MARGAPNHDGRSLSSFERNRVTTYQAFMPTGDVAYTLVATASRERREPPPARLRDRTRRAAQGARTLPAHHGRCRDRHPDASPHVNRLARAPGFPEIHEEDEDEDAYTPASPMPAARQKQTRASSSSLPSPSPPIVAMIQVDVDEQLLTPNPGKKRISRRQNGLINVGAGSSMSWAGGRLLSPSRPPSPTLESPIGREAGLAEEEEEMAGLSGKVEFEEEEEELLLERAMKKERKKKAKTREEERRIPPKFRSHTIDALRTVIASLK